MTAPSRAGPLPDASASLVAHVALVSITVSARAIVYSEARCPTCRRLVMAIPGTPTFEVRVVASNAERSGRGRVVSCRRCSTLCEIVEHR